jgi:galactofuranose transport system permease protein
MKERYLPIAATIVVFVALFLTGGALYNHFLSMLVFSNLLSDNAFIIIAAIGATFVILSGGIDLSIGSMIGFVGVAMAYLVSAGWHPLLAAAVMIAFGVGYGACVGWIIEAFEIQPFIITLAGLFLLRGACFMVSLDSVPIKHGFVDAFGEWRLPLPGDGFLTGSATVMLASLAGGIVIAHLTRFGTNIYAIGGDRTSAALMGVPIRRTTVMIYGLSGFYSSLAGVIYAFYTASGYPLAASGVELDAIAAVVLGGTLLTGGVGLVVGTLFGGLILGLITTIIDFDGTLTSAWARIVVGLLLFVFILAQRAILGSVTSFKEKAT